MFPQIKFSNCHCLEMMRQVSFWHVRRRPLWLLESRRTERRSRQGDGQLEAQVNFSLSHNSRGIWCVCGWGRGKSGLLPSRLLFSPSPGWAQSHWMRWRRCLWKRWSPTLAIGSSISVTIINHHNVQGECVMLFSVKASLTLSSAIHCSRGPFSQGEMWSSGENQQPLVLSKPLS